jgi:hypothetical protein
MIDWVDCLYGLVVRVPGYRSGGTRFYSGSYHISWETVGLERGPLGLVGIIEELLKKSIGSDGRSVGIVRLRTKATEFVFFVMKDSGFNILEIYKLTLLYIRPFGVVLYR